jgi:hypothetical protein
MCPSKQLINDASKHELQELVLLRSRLWEYLAILRVVRKLKIAGECACHGV